jgi:hypothetical protein
VAAILIKQTAHSLPPDDAKKRLESRAVARMCGSLIRRRRAASPAASGLARREPLVDHLAMVIDAMAPNRSARCAIMRNRATDMAIAFHRPRWCKDRDWLDPSAMGSV